jgi:hypothetical protein
MRDVPDTPRQLDLEFELAIDSSVTKSTVAKTVSNVVSVNFGQHKVARLKVSEHEEESIILERVLSNARRLGW